MTTRDVTLTRKQMLDLLDAANDRIEQMEDHIATEADPEFVTDLRASLEDLRDAHDALHRQAFPKLDALMREGGV